MEVGKTLIALGFMIMLVGGIMLFREKVSRDGLPGDLQLGAPGVRIYFPIVTCLVVSAVLSGLMWLLHFLRR